MKGKHARMDLFVDTVEGDADEMSFMKMCLRNVLFMQGQPENSWNLLVSRFSFHTFWINCYYQLLMSDRGFQTELNCQCNEGSFKFIWWDLFLSPKPSIHPIFYTTVCSWLGLLGLLESSIGVTEELSGIEPRCPLPFFHCQPCH